MTARCRGENEVCRENANCCSGRCTKDARGRFLCECPTKSINCVCASGQIVCNGACTDPVAFQTDPANCGECGTVCSGARPFCVDGDCVACRTGSDCNDGIDCTFDSCNTTTGLCEHTPVSDLCAPDTCFDSYCDPATGCVSVPTVCPDDGIACTVESCNPASGTCQSIPNDNLCTSDDLCLIPRCNPSSGCTTEPVVCNDFIDCTVDTCDPNTGECVYTPDPSRCPQPAFSCQEAFCDSLGCGIRDLCVGTICGNNCNQCSCTSLGCTPSCPV